MFREYHIKNYNLKFLFLIVIISGLGVVMINSADSSYTQKQLLGLAICGVGMLIVSFIDYNFICKLSIPLYIINLVLLVLVKVAGKNVNGATRWFAIGNYLTIQPSEFTKIIMIICVATYIQKHEEDLNKFKTLFKLAILCAVPILLILIQTDLSTSIDMVLILLSIIFVGGLSYKIIGIALLILVPAVGIFVWYIQQPNQKLLKDYQLDRILAFLHPQDYLNSTAYQQNNSMMAIGSGMLSGKGLNNNTMATVKETNFVSEQQTDFIFSVVGEELGFIGSIIFIAIYALIVIQCIMIATRAKNTAGKLIATGFGALILFQSFINIGVATALLPNTGLPLPFVSYGLSSLASLMAGAGLTLNVGLQKKK